MDHNVRIEVAAQLRRRGVSVTTAEEDGRKLLADPYLLDRAGALGCVLVSHDRDLLIEAARRQRQAIQFSGVIYAHPLHITVGQLVENLEIIAIVGDPAEIENRVEYLPL